MPGEPSTFRPAAPRMRLRRLDELDSAQRDALAPYPEQFEVLPNALLAMVEHVPLYTAWMGLATRLLDCGFTERQRELLIMRTAVVIGSDYEWGQHVRMSADVLTDDDRQRIIAGPDASGWTPLEAALVRAVDELHHHSGISDATWAALAAHLDQQQLIALPLIVGHYHMLGYVLHTLGVPNDAGCPPLP